jgi:hypothetical protein
MGGIRKPTQFQGKGPLIMRMSLILIIDNIQGHPLTNQRRLLLELLRDVEGCIDAKRLYAVPGPGMSLPLRLRCTAMVLMIGACFGN